MLIILVILVGLAAVRLTAVPNVERGGEEAPALDQGIGPKKRARRRCCWGVGGVEAYFPAFVGLTYNFAGEGMEFASFSRTISLPAQV